VSITVSVRGVLFVGDVVPPEDHVLPHDDGETPSLSVEYNIAYVPALEMLLEEVTLRLMEIVFALVVIGTRHSI
jgi:hypothetical protein